MNLKRGVYPVLFCLRSFMTNLENNKNLNNTPELTANELIKKFDKDSKSRTLTGYYKLGYNLLLIAFSIFVITVALLSDGMTPFTKLPLFLGFIMFLSFIKYPACEKDAYKENYIPWYDFILAFLSLFVNSPRA